MGSCSHQWKQDDVARAVYCRRCFQVFDALGGACRLQDLERRIDRLDNQLSIAVENVEVWKGRFSALSELKSEMLFQQSLERKIRATAELANWCEVKRGFWSAVLVVVVCIAIEALH